MEQLKVDFKDFDIHLGRLASYLKDGYPSYDGISTQEDHFLIIFTEQLSELDRQDIISYIESLTQESEDQKRVEEEQSKKWKSLIRKRDSLFIETEWVKLRHRDEQDLGSGTTLTTQQYQDWLLYWQQLRDLDLSSPNGRDPDLIVFPEQPTI